MSVIQLLGGKGWLRGGEGKGWDGRGMIKLIHYQCLYEVVLLFL